MALHECFFELINERWPTQAAAAEDLGIAPSALVNYKKGRVPRADELFRISQKLGVSMEKLLHGKESKSKVAPCNLEIEPESTWERDDRMVVAEDPVVYGGKPMTREEFDSLSKEEQARQTMLGVRLVESKPEKPPHKKLHKARFSTKAIESRLLSMQAEVKRLKTKNKEVIKEMEDEFARLEFLLDGTFEALQENIDLMGED